MSYSPKWVTPQRQAYLIKLFEQSQGFCIYGHSPCKGSWKAGSGKRLFWHCAYSDHTCYAPFEAIYAQVEANLIKDWVLEDRRNTLDLHKAEFVANHRTNDRTYPLHGQYSGISQDIYFDSQADYFIESLGISGLTFKPFVKIRLASSQVRLFVDLASVLKPLSKNARRKAIRYRHIPARLADRIDIACYQAVKHFKASR